MDSNDRVQTNYRRICHGYVDPAAMLPVYGSLPEADFSLLGRINECIGDLSLAEILLGAQVERCSRCVSFKNTYFAHRRRRPFQGRLAKNVSGLD